MSDFISGQDIVIEYGILPFELLNRFIHLGLSPINPHTGREIEVSRFLGSVFKFQEKDDNADPKDELLKNFIDANSEMDWSNFQLSGDDEMDLTINEALLVHIYKRKHYEKLVAMDQINRHGLPALPQAHVKVAAKKSKRTPTIHKNILIQRAERIWQAHPTMPPSELCQYPAYRRDIIKNNGESYGEGFFRNCLKNRWPQPYQGPSKNLDIPNVTIEALLQDL